MRSRVAFPIVFLALAACGGQSATDDHSTAWLSVLHHKKAAVAPQATPRDKQVYADSVAAFVDQHPTHSRAREVYVRMQLDFAHELAAIGRHQDAIRFYRAILDRDPANAEARNGLKTAADHLAVSREKLLTLEKGMSQHEVAKLLGKPIPGWTAKNDRRDAVIESWYYRRSEGGLAGVYFRDGKLFAAEENSQARLAPLVQ